MDVGERTHIAIWSRTGVSMINLTDAVSLLRAKRDELENQLKAVDQALAALSVLDVGAVPAPAPAPTPRDATEEAAGPVLPTRLKPVRTLSDEHKHALREGRRKARHAREAAKGLAREIPDPSSGLTPAADADGQAPRLVKRRTR